MFSEEVDWLTDSAARAGRCCFYPGAEVVHVGGASHGGTAVRREPPRPSALPRQAPRPATRPSGRAGSCSGRCGCARSSSAVTAGLRTATARASSPPATSARSSEKQPLGDRIPAARVRHGRRAGAGCRRRTCARAARSTRTLLAWATASVFVAWALVFAVHGRSGSPRSCSRRSSRSPLQSSLLRPRRPRRRAARVRRAVAVARRASFSVGLSGMWPEPSPATGSSTRRAFASSSTLGDLHLRTVDEFKDGGLHPGLRVPALARLPRARLVGLRASTPPTSSATSRRCSRRSRASGVGGGRRRLRLALGRRIACSLATLGAVRASAPATAASYASLALPATAARQLLVPAAIALFFVARAPGAAERALVVVFGALALVHPTYALFVLVPLAAYALLQPRAWREWAPTLAAAVVPIGLALLWLRPIVDETRLARSRARANERARSRSTQTSSS